MVDTNKPFLDRDEDYREEISLFYGRLFNGLESDEILYLQQMIIDELNHAILRYVNPLSL